MFPVMEEGVRMVVSLCISYVILYAYQWQERGILSYTSVQKYSLRVIFFQIIFLFLTIYFLNKIVVSVLASFIHSIIVT